MNRRNFLESSLKIPLSLAGIGLVFKSMSETAFGCETVATQGSGLKSFAFYQGLAPTQARSPSRTDGTYSSMPCILAEDVEQGEAKTYEFWHGHEGKTHHFTITEEGFSKLASGESIEIFTDVVTGHRHSLKIDPSLACKIK